MPLPINLYSLIRVAILQPIRPERILCGDPPLRIQFQHLVQQVQRRCRHKHKVLSHSPSILLLRLQRPEQWQFDDTGPHRRRWSAADPRDHVQLHRLCVALEQWLLHEQFAQDAPTAPHIDRGSVPLLAQQQLWRTIPQRNHFVRVRPVAVLGVIQPGQSKVSQLYFTTGEGIKKDIKLNSH